MFYCASCINKNTITITETSDPLHHWEELYNQSMNSELKGNYKKKLNVEIKGCKLYRDLMDIIQKRCVCVVNHNPHKLVVI